MDMDVMDAEGRQIEQLSEALESLAMRVDELIKLDVDELQERLGLLKELTDEKKRLCQEVMTLRDTVYKNAKKVEELEMSMTKNNLIFGKKAKATGVDDDVKYNTPEELVEQICKLIIHGKYYPGCIDAVIPRTRKGKISYKVIFKDGNVVQEILSNVRTLSGSDFFINRDYSPRLREKRRRLLFIRRRIMSKNEGIKPTLRGTTLIVEGKKITWEKDRGLISEEEKDMDFIKNLLGVEIWDDYVTKETKSDNEEEPEEGEQEAPEDVNI